MGTLRKLSHKGDEQVTWNQAAVQAGDLGAEAAVREAERIFNEVRAAGGSAYLMENGRGKVRITVFDPTAAFILLLPAVIGG